MRWAFAEFPTVIRSAQKDTQSQHRLQDLLDPLLQRHFHKFGWAERLSPIVYFLCTTVVGEKTLGEEYCNILQVDTRQRDLPPLWKRLIFTLSTVIPSLLASAKNRRLRLVGKIANLLLTIQVSLFYFGWIPAYHASKWLLALRYVVHPRRDPQPRKRLDFLYLLLGIASLCMAASEVVKLYKELRANKAAEPDNPPERLKADETCTLCLNRRKDSSSLACGHVFCWSCICKWLHHRPECPLCREPAFHADILHLQNLP